MKIRTTFIINMLLFGLVLTTVAASLVIANQWVDRLNKQEEIAINIERGTSELNYLSNDYLLYHEDQQRARWQAKWTSMSHDIARLNPDNSEAQVIVDNIKDNHQRLKAVFDNVASTFQDKTLSAGADSAQSIAQVSWSRLAVQNQGMAFDALHLSQIIRDQKDQLKQTSSILIIVLLGAFIAYFIANYFIIQRRLFKSIADLHAGAKIVGSGNLDFALEIKRNDEIGELSNAFNQMTTDLKGVTASKAELEREIIEREAAERALYEERERLFVTLESIGDGVIATDVNSKIVFLNSVAQELTGWTQEEAAGKPLLEIFNIINEETREPAEDPVGKAIKKGVIVGLANHTALIGKDGTELSIADSCAPIRAIDGSIIGAVLVIRDVTDEKKAERLRDALNEINSSITSTLDFDEIMQSVVVKAAKAIGAESAAISLRKGDRWVVSYAHGFPQDIIGSQMIDDQERHAVLAIKTRQTVAVDDAFNDERVNQEHMKRYGVRSAMTLPLTIKDDVIGAIFLNYHSHLHAFTGYEIDFADKLASSMSLALENSSLFRRLENAFADITESRRQVLDVLESISDGFFSLDSLSRITYINSKAQGLLGMRKEEVLFKSLWDKLPNAQVLRLYRELHLAVEHKTATSFDEFIPPLDKWFEFHIYPYDYGVSVYFSDVTERRQAEEKLKANQQKLQDQNEELEVMNEELRITTEELTLAEHTLKESKRLSDALNDINAIINSTLDPDEIMQRVVEEAAKATNAIMVGMSQLKDGHWVLKYAYKCPGGIVDKRFEDKIVNISVIADETKEPVIVEDIHTDHLVNRELMESVGVHSLVAVPIIVKGSVIGVFTFFYPVAPLPFGEVLIDFAKKTASATSLALENARLYKTERHIADTLQEAIMRLPSKIERINFGHLYRSATEAAKVGGDFYDIFELGNNKVGIVIGDVSGKGIEAAELTSLAKNAIRAYAFDEHSPSKVMAKTNNIVRQASPLSSFITLFFGILDVEKQCLTYCNAGHPPAVLMNADAEVEPKLLNPNSPIIGAFADLEYAESEIFIQAKDMITLYTDGIIEARRGNELFGQERLISAIKELRPICTKELPQAIFAKVMDYTGEILLDDAALFVVSLEGVKCDD